MSKKTKLIFQSILIIVKNATIIIPILEGIVDAIYSVRHPEDNSVKDAVVSHWEEDGYKVEKGE